MTHTGTLTHIYHSTFQNPRWRTIIVLTTEKYSYVSKGLTNLVDLAVTHINPLTADRDSSYCPDQPLKLRTLTLNQHQPYTCKTEICLVAAGHRTQCGNLRHFHRPPPGFTGKGRIRLCLTGRHPLRLIIFLLIFNDHYEHYIALPVITSALPCPQVTSGSVQ